jgi:hypothetical protein
MTKVTIGLAAVAAILATGTVAQAKSVTGVVNQNTSVNGKAHVNNIRLCNNRCTISGDYAGNIVGIGNQNLGPTSAGKSSGHSNGHSKGHKGYGMP